MIMSKIIVAAASGLASLTTIGFAWVPFLPLAKRLFFIILKQERILYLGNELKWKSHYHSLLMPHIPPLTREKPKAMKTKEKQYWENNCSAIPIGEYPL